MRDFFWPAGSGWGNTGASPGMQFPLSLTFGYTATLLLLP